MAATLSELVTSIDNDKSEIPLGFKLEQNYPNPFNPKTVIGYRLPVTSNVSLKVYNLLGQKIATLFEGIRQTGNYEAIFDGSKFASGVYFYQLGTSSFTETKKLILTK
jgi:hypothetical protein